MRGLQVQTPEGKHARVPSAPKEVSEVTGERPRRSRPGQQGSGSGPSVRESTLALQVGISSHLAWRSKPVMGQCRGLTGRHPGPEGFMVESWPEARGPDRPLCPAPLRELLPAAPGLGGHMAVGCGVSCKGSTHPCPRPPAQLPAAWGCGLWGTRSPAAPTWEISFLIPEARLFLGGLARFLGGGGGSKCQGKASLWRLPTERPMLGDCGVCSRQDSPRVVLGTPGDLYLGPSQCWGYPGRWVVCAVISCPFPVLRLLWNPLPQAMWADSWLQVSPWIPGWSGNSWSHFSMAGTPGWVRTDDGARLWSGGLSKCLILTQKMALPK